MGTKPSHLELQLELKDALKLKVISIRAIHVLIPTKWQINICTISDEVGGFTILQNQGQESFGLPWHCRRPVCRKTWLVATRSTLLRIIGLASVKSSVLAPRLSSQPFPSSLEL